MAIFLYGNITIQEFFRVPLSTLMFLGKERFNLKFKTFWR